MGMRCRWSLVRKKSLPVLLAPALVVAASFGGVAAPNHNWGPISAMAADASPILSDMEGHWGKNAVEWAVGEGIVNGFADGTFKPNQQVNEAEFLTMLLRAYVGSTIPAAKTGDAWYAPYYAFAAEMHWPVNQGSASAVYTRGQVARLLAASQGKELGEAAAVAFLLDNAIAQGKTANTVAGFGAGDTLTRAEAVQFIRNMKQKVKFVTGLAAQTGAFAVRGISIGDTAETVQTKLGAPSRRDPSEYGFEWSIYNADYAQYAQIGIKDGKVVALYTNSPVWTAREAGIGGAGKTSADVTKAYGKPLDALIKGSSRFLLNNPGVEDGVYEIEGAYVTFFYDTHENNALEAIQIIAKDVEQARADYYPPASDALRQAFEREVFDLANAARVKRGLTAFSWDDGSAAVARGHSGDMGKTGYFDHTSPGGQQLKDRFEAAGIAYKLVGENIAAGQPNAITAHAGWLNSHTGHRKSLLGNATHLGVGVYFGGSLHVYYTQNFYTPME
ncbi:CAP-associated domain-containing protein [Paenibacillus hodogayensis]|uniref:CAP-associated domain-containing protein n=1 Tax=Paenibacillus hodogayensis TaxID=279208 RepID=A0ABV5VS53_9BACL